MDRPRNVGEPTKDVCRRCNDIIERGLLDEGPFNAEEKSFLDEHVTSCADCGHFYQFIELFEDAPSIKDDVVEKAIEAHFSGGTKRSGQRRRLFSLIAAAAAVLLLITVTLFRGMNQEDSDSIQKNTLAMTLASGTANLGGQLVSPGIDLVEGAVLTTAGEQILMVADSLTIGLAADSEVEIKVASNDSMTLGLRKGTVAVDLDPERHLSFDIEVDAYRVRVTGTTFSVETGRGTAVRVVEGTVRVAPVSSTEDKDAVEVVADRTYIPADQSHLPLEKEKRRAILKLLQQEEPNRADADEAVKNPEAARDQDSNQAESKENGFSREEESHRSRGQRRKRNETFKQAPPRGRASTRERPEKQGANRAEQERKPLTAAHYIRQARACRARRDWKCAAASYRKVMDVYPGDPLARTVIVPLAQIELKHLGGARRSQRLFAEYLRIDPHGPLSQEASYGICQALEAMGDSVKEIKALKDFLRRFPKSAYAPNARNRLRELGQGGPGLARD